MNVIGSIMFVIKASHVCAYIRSQTYLSHEKACVCTYVHRYIHTVPICVSTSRSYAVWTQTETHTNTYTLLYTYTPRPSISPAWHLLPPCSTWPSSSGSTGSTCVPCPGIKSRSRACVYRLENHSRRRTDADTQNLMGLFRETKYIRMKENDLIMYLSGRNWSPWLPRSSSRRSLLMLILSSPATLPPWSRSVFIHCIQDSFSDMYSWVHFVHVCKCGCFMLAMRITFSRWFCDESYIVVW